jgi:hypothetical protein
MHYRVFAAPGRLSALRHPLIGVANRKSELREGKRKRERERRNEKREEREIIRRVGKGA